MTITEIISRFDAKRNGKEWVAQCPIHDDSTPSLSINEGKNGGVVMICRAGCKIEDVLTARGLKLADLMPDKSKESAPIFPKIVDVYDYTDADGKLLFQVCRYKPKDFKQRRPDPDHPGEWLWNMNGTQRVLYKLPKVIKAVKAGQIIWIVEGEKAVHAAEAVGLVATNSPGGASKWNDEYSKFLKGATCFIIPDNDGPGRDHAKLVEKSLHGIAKNARIIELPGLPVKGDLHDFVESRDAQDVEVIRNEIISLTVEKELFEIWALSDIQKYVPDPKNYIAGNGWLRRGAGTLLTGGTGIGKSILAEQISLYVAAGINILGCIAIKQSFRVLHIQAENDQDTIKRDIESIIKNIEPQMDTTILEKNFHICHAYGLGGDAFALWLRLQCEKLKPDLLSIDPYQAFIPGNMDINSSACFLSWIKPINTLIRDFNCALVLVAHTPKPRDREGWTARESVYMAAGSSSISNWARTSAELTQVGQEDSRFRLRFGKNAERTGIVQDNGHIARDIFIEHSQTIKEPYWLISQSQEEPSKSKYRDEIVTLALAHPSMSQREIAKQVGCSNGMVAKWYPSDAKNQ